jgi:hypothetical protein
VSAARAEDDPAVAGAQRRPPPACSCRGGQGTLPNEQKTQQSPGLGFSTASHEVQSYKYWQASVGMTSVFSAPQRGQVIIDSRMGCALDIDVPQHEQSEPQHQAG